jgi:hypothetical protein
VLAALVEHLEIVIRVLQVQSDTGGNA